MTDETDPKTPKKHRVKVPNSPAGAQAYAAKRRLWAAILQGEDWKLVCELAEVALECARIAAVAEPPFFSVAQVAERWGLNRKTVESIPIPRYKFGNSIRISRDDLLKWELESREKQ